uniref:Uncharacterized protein n=1 Tax=Lepeophtheirus salmonis TaxID=72036 RepID=A0A0K2T8T0_LEPSM
MEKYQANLLFCISGCIASSIIKFYKIKDCECTTFLNSDKSITHGVKFSGEDRDLIKTLQDSVYRCNLKRVSHLLYLTTLHAS